MIGLICPTLVFVLADASLNENDLYVYKVFGLSTENGPDAFGYVCFTQTRCANDKFFKWLNEAVLIPFITRLRLNYRLTTNPNAFVFCDGEHVQIIEYFTDETKKLLDDENVIVGKLAASTTAVSQACDAYKMFSNTHKRAGTIVMEEVNNCTGLQAQLNFMFQEYQHDTRHGYKASLKSKALIGLVKCYLAIVKELKAPLVCKSFSRIGMQLDGDRGWHVNAKQVFLQFSQTLHTNHMVNLYSKIDFGIKCYHTRGEMTDAELRTFDVARDLFDSSIDSSVRDSLTLSSQRCVLISHLQTVMRFENKIKEKEAQAAAVIAAKEARLAQTAKRKAEEELKKANRLALMQAKAQKAETSNSTQKKAKLVHWCTCKFNSALHNLNDSDDWVECSALEECIGGFWFHFACLGQGSSWVPPERWICSACSRKRGVKYVT
jgi:hypothetical protein